MHGDLKNIEKPLKLGDLLGNSFTITIRGISESPKEIKSIIEGKIQEIKSGKGIFNYYGLQRFGEVRPITHMCGKSLLKNDLEGCLKTYLCKSFEDENPLHKKFRINLSNNWDLTQAQREIPRNLYY